MDRPAPTSGLRHVALISDDLESCERFYTDLLGMTVEWRPDPDNVYLTSGNDNLALHRAEGQSAAATSQRLDHIGFILEAPEDVDDWYGFLKAHDVVMRTTVKTHRDGARSFYCEDPDKNIVQMIYHPPISGKG
ncbi:MAG: VOC family protein [Anaerolineae bacterium]|nr:MAG: VOC family protein [Anaerolineae bacterium]